MPSLPPDEAKDLAFRLHRIQKLTEELLEQQRANTDSRELAERIQKEIIAARAAMKIVQSP